MNMKSWKPLCGLEPLLLCPHSPAHKEQGRGVGAEERQSTPGPGLSSFVSIPLSVSSEGGAERVG